MARIGDPGDRSKDNQTSRRKFLRKGGAVASALYLAASPVVGRKEKMVMLPKFISGGEVTEYFEAPEAWDSHRKHAKNVQQRVIDEFSNDDGVYGFGLSRSEITYGGKNGLQVTLIVAEEFDAEKLPGEIDGIPVTTDVGSKGRLGDCSVSGGTGDCVNYEDDTFVHGGEFVGGQHGGGTAAMKMSDSNNNEYLLTVAHLFRDSSNCPNDVDGEIAKVYDGTDIGTVDTSNVEDDWAIIDLNSDSDTSNLIDDNDVTPSCDGVVAEATLQNWDSQSKSNRPCLYQMGCTTGKTTGRLKYANYAISSSSTNPSCVTYNSDGSADGVYTYCDFGEGDSGGPTWHMENGDAYLVSTTSTWYLQHTTTCGGKAVGTDSSGMGAYAIEAENSNLTIP